MFIKQECAVRYGGGRFKRLAFPGSGRDRLNRPGILGRIFPDSCECRAIRATERTGCCEELCNRGEPAPIAKKEEDEL